ncbi:MAG: anthranilate synthase component I [Phycisphaerae bacterium]
MSGLSFRPSLHEFAEEARRFNSIPIVATLIWDDLTPVSAFARLGQGEPRAFLFESVVGGERVARYSFVSAAPRKTYRAEGDSLTIVDHESGDVQQESTHDPLEVLQSHLAAVTPAPRRDLPRFLGGAVGYAGYDVVRYSERLKQAPRDDRNFPDVIFDLYDAVVIFDHVHKLLHIVAHAHICEATTNAAQGEAYEAACRRIRGIAERLRAAHVTAPIEMPAVIPSVAAYTSNFTQVEFEEAVRKCQAFIRAGDIFQVVLSQRLEVRTASNPFDIYRASRVVNPSPFMFYYQCPEVVLVGASPEIMCRVEDGVITNRPLAGTRKRGLTPEEDERLREELLADPKERAEHVMLVDLGRNDVGRVSAPQSVKLTELMAVEKYSHVMHLSSTVTGRLREGLTAIDALRATLPVGTVSGAPKVRAMEIIDELEPTRRGPYAGAVGYIDFTGNMDTCIALRTLVMKPHTDGTFSAYVQAGAGVVADSVPAREYEETINKSKSMLAAIALADSSIRATKAVS